MAGAAVLTALLLEINAAVLVIIFGAFVVHEIATTVDIRVAYAARMIKPVEQRTHDFTTAIPFAALCLTFATHTDRVLALFGLGDVPADWGLRWKTPALPLSYLITWISSAVLFNALPFAEELWRGLSAPRNKL